MVMCSMFMDVLRLNYHVEKVRNDVEFGVHSDKQQNEESNACQHEHYGYRDAELLHLDVERRCREEPRRLRLREQDCVRLDVRKRLLVAVGLGEREKHGQDRAGAFSVPQGHCVDLLYPVVDHPVGLVRIELARVEVVEREIPDLDGIRRFRDLSAV